MPKDKKEHSRDSENTNIQQIKTTVTITSRPSNFVEYFSVQFHHLTKLLVHTRKTLKFNNYKKHDVQSQSLHFTTTIRDRPTYAHLQSITNLEVEFDSLAAT